MSKREFGYGATCLLIGVLQFAIVIAANAWHQPGLLTTWWFWPAVAGGSSLAPGFLYLVYLVHGK